MAPSVWTLVLLLLGDPMGQAHKPSHVKRERPLIWKLLVPRSESNSVVTKCDFDDNAHPLCDWTQVSANDGNWTRAKGPGHTETTGPPGGYPNQEGYYMLMDARAFRQGGVARLSSPPLSYPGPLCVHFAYHMFGLSWGAQIKLLLLPSAEGAQPRLLWKHRNIQSTSWMPTAVTVPAGLAQPARLMFEAVRGSTTSLDIALDALSVFRGPCQPTCEMKTCNFDTPNDLCGWSWIPSPTGAKWVQKTGSSGDPNAGPMDDFSRPGSGSYMLLDPKDANPGQKATLVSPLSQSSGCLGLSFQYTLRGRSAGATIIVKAAPMGSVQKDILFLGQPGPSWQSASVNYTNEGQIQFFIVGVFGAVPDPAVAVDAVTIAPCRESLPQCDFEDDAHPFCDWIQDSKEGGHWTRGSRNTAAGHATEPSGGSPHREGLHYIYLKSDEDKHSLRSHPVQLASRFFCAVETVCMEFAYHMYGTGEDTMLNFLLRTLRGQATSIWSRLGFQSPLWQQASITIAVPSGHQQPIQLILEAVDVAVGFIMIHYGACSELTPAALPRKNPPALPLIPPGNPTNPTEQSTTPTKPTTTTTTATTTTTTTTTIPTQETTASTQISTVSTQGPAVPTENPTVATERPTLSTEEPTAPIQEFIVPNEESTLPVENTPPPEAPTVPTEKPTAPTPQPTTPTERPTVPTENPTTSTEKPTVPAEKPTPINPKTEFMSPGLKPSEQAMLMVTVGTPSTLSTTTTPRPTPVTCPSDAHYESCACPASCENRKPTCPLPCRPGCVCNPGFLFSLSSCIPASSCHCFYNNNYYKGLWTRGSQPNAYPRPRCPGSLRGDRGLCECPVMGKGDLGDRGKSVSQLGDEWYSPNCTERCLCSKGSRLQCQPAQCGTHKVCQLQDGQYGCHPYGTATCLTYGDPHYLTFDGRHFNFMGKCTYVLTHPCKKSADPYFRVAVKNEEQGQEGVSCLSKVHVTLPQTTITLIKGKRILIGGHRVTLPAMPSPGVFLVQSGRFVELQTALGLRVRWDGDQQLHVTVTSTYFNQLCGFCGNYDGDSSNDNQKPDGTLARDDEDLGNSWQIVEDQDKECQKNLANAPSCDSTLHNQLLGPEFCGRLIDPEGIFGACLPHLKPFFYYESCLLDMCHFQGLQHMLCSQMAALTEACQEAGLMVKPWRDPQFCPLACPSNSRYSLCTKSCPDTCYSGFSGMACPDRCVEGCECNPGFVLSGLQCVPKDKCGCLRSPGSYVKAGESWYKEGCKERCHCEAGNNIHCVPWQCGPWEVCILQAGVYGCHAQGIGICSISGDPHYVTFDGALHHFMGTCTYLLTKLCLVEPQESYFTVSATNENRGGDVGVSYVKAVHVQTFNVQLSLIKGRKVMLNNRRVALPLWLAQGQMSVALSGSFILVQTDFGLRVRYDGSHLVDVTVPSTYVGRLCGLCGNFNNNSSDDNLGPDKKPAESSVQLGAAWLLPSASESGCFVAGGKTPNCPEKGVTKVWNRNCEILISPYGPFSQCHEVVSPKNSFNSCVDGQSGTHGDTLALCRSLQAYVALCAQAGRPLTWRNSTFCPLKCPPGSRYSPCTNPCPTTCLSMDNPRECPLSLPCAEGCECQRGHVLSGISCVPLSQCGCTDKQGSYHPVGERWYADSTCSTLCTCSSQNNITCSHTRCSPTQMCWPLDGLLRCRSSGLVGVCHVSGDPNYVSFDGSYHSFRGTCTYILAQVCHPNLNLPFFKISAKNEKQSGHTPAYYLHHINIYIHGTHIVLQRDHHVLVNGKPVTLPVTQIRHMTISINGIYTVFKSTLGVLVKFDGNHLLEIQIPKAYYQKVCGVCGNFNGEEEDELMMPNDELAQNDIEFGNSWKDADDSDPNCLQNDREVRLEHRENPHRNCKPDDITRAQQQCQAAFQGSGWSECTTQMTPRSFLTGCTYNLCELGGGSHAICDALQAFGVACQTQGFRPPFWRNNTFCPLKCPMYSSYTQCVPPCPPACGSTRSECQRSKLFATCFEGCLCNPGFVLSEDRCVLKSQCHCMTSNGNVLPAGKTWLSTGCNQKCACTEGNIQCWVFHCPSGSHCQLDPKGNSNCVPDWLDHCSISGDPHYRTLDGFQYNFQGPRTYILVKTVPVLPLGVEAVVVEGRNKMSKFWSPVYLHEVLVEVYGFRIQLGPGLDLLVNDEKVAIPYKPNENLLVCLRSHRLYLTTDVGLSVSFNGDRHAVISMPSTYLGLVHGLCGNFDRNQNNELMLPSGDFTDNISVFGNSWEVKENQVPLVRVPRATQEEGQEGGQSGFRLSECSPEQLVNNTQACRVLADPQGLFAACHQTMAPEPFQEHCMIDLCAARDPEEWEERRCQVLSGYAFICQEAGAPLAGWRNHTGCAMKCPANTEYQSCMTPCPASCANPGAPQDCEGPCVEGCASLPGYVYSGARSLPLADCGCVSDGVYYQRGDSFVTQNCSQRCTCASKGLLLCDPFSCEAGEVCTLGNHTRGCFRESPCLQNPCQNDGRCQEQGTTFTCECVPGYGGDRCTEPRDAPPPEKPEASNLVAVLLGMLVPMAFIMLAVTRKYLHRKRKRREKTLSQNLDTLANAAFIPQRALIPTPF